MLKEGNFVAKGSTFHSPKAEVTQKSVGHDDEIPDVPLDRADRRLDRRVRIGGARADRVLL